MDADRQCASNRWTTEPRVSRIRRCFGPSDYGGGPGCRSAPRCPRCANRLFRGGVSRQRGRNSVLEYGHHARHDRGTLDLPIADARSTIMRPNLSSGRGNPATARRPRKPVSRQHGQPGGRRGTISSLPAKRRTEIEPLDRCRPRLVGAAPLFTGPSCQPLRQRAAQDGRQQVVLDPRVPRSVAFRSRGVGGAASIVPVARPEPPGTPSAPPPARWRLFPSNRRGTSSPTMRSAVCVTHRSLLAGNQFENVD